MQTSVHADSAERNDLNACFGFHEDFNLHFIPQQSEMDNAQTKDLGRQGTKKNRRRSCKHEPRTHQSTKCLDISRRRPLKPSEIKRPQLETERLRLRTAIYQSFTPFVHELRSAEEDMVRGYVYLCTELDLRDTFFGLIPARIGFDEAVDSAANALIHLFAGDQKSRASEILCTRKYVHAITTLRNSMLSMTWRQSDAALLAIFLLAFYEHKLRHDERTFSEAHRKGMCAVLVTQASSRSDHATEALRSLLYQAWNSSFRTPCIQGTPSPFDLPELLDLNPPSQFKLPAALAHLRKVSNQLIIRLPALIASFRQLRQAPQFTKESLARDVSEKALDLLALRDKDGENAVLHRVKIITSSSESPLSKSSFHFEQPSEFKTTVHYWGARILICRICIALLRMDIIKESATCTEAQLRAENERSASNMTMTWDYGQAHGAILGRTVLVPGYTFVWGVLLDHETFRNLPSDKVRAWLLTRIHSFEPGMSVHVTEQELDDASEAFVGGPIAGLQNPALESFFGI